MDLLNLMKEKKKSKRLNVSCELCLVKINVRDLNCHLNLSLCLGIVISLPMLFDSKIPSDSCCDKKQVRVLLFHLFACISAVFIFCMSDPQAAD